MTILKIFRLFRIKTPFNVETLIDASLHSQAFYLTARHKWMERGESLVGAYLQFAPTKDFHISARLTHLIFRQPIFKNIIT